MTRRRVRRPTLFSLWRKARRENSAASRLLGSTSLRFALHGWQCRNLSLKGLHRCSATLLPKNTVLLTTRAPIGYVALSANPIATNQGFRSLIVKPEFDHEFLYYWLKVNKTKLERHASGSTFKELSGTALKNIAIRLPTSKAEQRAIAHILGSLDDKIELNRQMAQTLESIARAIFKSWFVDFDPVKAKMEGKQPEGMTEEIAALFPDRLVDSELEMIPEGWDIATMQDLGTIKGGATPSTKNPDYWEGGTNHWITPKDMSNLDSIAVLDTSRKITDSGMQRISSRQLPAGTVLMSSRAPVGYLAISAIPISINQGFIAIVCNKSIPNSYVLYLLESNMDKIKMSSGGSTFSEISKRNFRPIKILLPNKDLLVKFNEIIEPIVDKMTRLQREVTTLSSLRDALLPKLISGELRIKDFERFLGKVA